MNRTSHNRTIVCHCAVRLMLLLVLVCIHASMAGAQTVQPTPKPSTQTSPRRPLPKLSTGARGFDFTKGPKDASSRLIAVGGGWGGGPEKEPRLRGRTAKAYYELGNKYLKQIEFAKAIPPLVRAVKLNPNYLAAYKALGEAYAFDGSISVEGIDDQVKAIKFLEMRYRQAIGAFEQADRLAPGNAGIHLNLGILYFNTGNYQKSIAAFQSGLLLKPKGGENQASLWETEVLSDSQIYDFIGQAFEYLGQPQSAVKFYQQALDLDPKDDLYQEIGEVYQQLGEPDKALAAYEKAISNERLDEWNPEILLHIGELYVSKQNFKDAVAAFAKVIAIYGKQLSDYRQYLAERTNETADTRKYWTEESTRLLTKLALTHYNLGVAQLSLQQTEKAVESFKQVIELDAANANARFNLGVAYLAQGNKEAALEQARLLKPLDSELSSELEALISK